MSPQESGSASEQPLAGPEKHGDLASLDVLRMAAMPARPGAEDELSFTIRLLRRAKAPVLIAELELTDEGYFVGVTVFGGLYVSSPPKGIRAWRQLLDGAADQHRHVLYDFAASIARMQLSLINETTATVPTSTPEPVKELQSVRR